MEVVGLVTSGTKAESTEPIFKALMAQRLQRDSPFLRPSALTWGGPRPERERERDPSQIPILLSQGDPGLNWTLCLILPVMEGGY